MPFLEEKYGSKDVQVIEFGKNDIGVAPSIEPNNELWVYEGIMPEDHKPLDGSWDLTTKQTTDDITNTKTPLVFRFPTTESLYVLKEAIDVIYTRMRLAEGERIPKRFLESAAITFYNQFVFSDPRVGFTLSKKTFKENMLVHKNAPVLSGEEVIFERADKVYRYLVGDFNMEYYLFVRLPKK